MTPRRLCERWNNLYTRTTIEIVDRLDVSPVERHAIYEGNARRLMKLA